MDGITYIIPRNDVDKAKSIAEEMTRITGLTIETNEYSKMVLRDVNNYLSIYSDKHTKLKGCFEIDKEIYKDPSMKIVPIALKNYFVDGIPVKDTIINHTDIYDFCLRLKTNSLSTAQYNFFNKETKEFETIILDRTTRYYISNGGGYLYKVFKEGKTVGVNIGYSVTIFNKYEEKKMNEYNINYNFYINEAMKIINSIETHQMSLFG